MFKMNDLYYVFLLHRTYSSLLQHKILSTMAGTLILFFFSPCVSFTNHSSADIFFISVSPIVCTLQWMLVWLSLLCLWGSGGSNGFTWYMVNNWNHNSQMRHLFVNQFPSGELSSRVRKGRCATKPKLVFRGHKQLWRTGARVGVRRHRLEKIEASCQDSIRKWKGKTELCFFRSVNISVGPQ